MKYKCIKNFLKKNDYNNFYNIINDKYFPWFYSDAQTMYVNKDRFFFYHNLFYEGEHSSPYCNIIDVFIKRLKIKKLLSAKLNLVTKDSSEKYISHLHVDNHVKKAKTAIYYINTNKGFTFLKADKNIKVLCEENKIFIFDSRIEHCVISQTDTNKRMVLNLNYL